MSLLTIAQNIASEVGVVKPTVIIGSNDETARRLLAACSAAGRNLARKKGRSHWIELIKEYSFDTVASQAAYDLPSDFYTLVDRTLWDRDNYWEMRGPLSPMDWQYVKSSVLGDSVVTRKRWRIKDDSGTLKFFVDPTPTAAESLVFEYVSNAWCQSSGGAGQTEWLNDSDTGVIDEYLIERDALWRFRNILGLNYLEEKAESQDLVDQALARQGGAPTIELGRKREMGFLSANNIPDTGYGQ